MTPISTGTTGSYATFSTLPTTRYSHRAATYNGYIFVSGGQNSDGALFSTVYSAQIKSDGTIGSWATLSTLPEIKYYHSMVAYNGYLYVTGGVSQTTVFSAQIKSDGTIGSWLTLT